MYEFVRWSDGGRLFHTNGPLMENAYTCVYIEWTEQLSESVWDVILTWIRNKNAVIENHEMNSL